MSRGWKPSGLSIGTEVRFPKEYFEAPKEAKERLESATIIGETESGILVDCRFKPSLRTINPNASHYRMFFSWASIWCGYTKVYTEDGEPIRAYRQTAEELTDDE